MTAPFDGGTFHVLQSVVWSEWMRGGVLSEQRRSIEWAEPFDLLIGRSLLNLSLNESVGGNGTALSLRTALVSVENGSTLQWTERLTLSMVDGHLERGDGGDSLYVRYRGLSTLSIAGGGALSFGGPWFLLFGLYDLSGGSWTDHITLSGIGPGRPYTEWLLNDAMHRFLVYDEGAVSVDIGRSVFSLFDRVAMTVSVGDELTAEPLLVAMSPLNGSMASGSGSWFVAECGRHRAAHFNAFGWHYAVFGAAAADNIEGGASYNVTAYWAPTENASLILGDAERRSAFQLTTASKTVSIRNDSASSQSPAVTVWPTAKDESERGAIWFGAGSMASFGINTSFNIPNTPCNFVPLFREHDLIRFAIRQ